MVSCAQTQCPASASSLTISDLSNLKSLLSSLQVTISPKAQYSYQNSLVPDTDKDPDQDAFTLALNGTGACLTSPYLFRSFVPRATGLASVDRICQIKFYDREECQEHSATTVEVGGKPAADGQCIFHGGRSASLGCDVALLLQALMKSVVEDIDTQARSYFDSRCGVAVESANGASGRLASPEGHNGANSTYSSPLKYSTGVVSTMCPTSSTHSTESAGSTSSSSLSTVGPSYTSASMALEERSASHSLVALVAGLFVATAML
ncbi:hypothetical protein K431DRAFT_291132 [Polychaeton citri CBS 116435]|uniref:Uncharacterized protein n=1 Tax=Polychaeton citri CBS 116435 TaxID=1314669 RepID=A0A9P4QG09_9PEZI|nr:hypothetical protein K431DRAFT_291132 [Polychaeton citri CBS 116435]